MRGHRDLRAVSAVSLLCALLALLAPWETVAFVFAAPLALILPGYAITAAAFARRRLAWPQFLALTLALSLATLVLGSLVLNYVPGGIRAFSWALLLPLVVLNGCRTAALRRAGEPALPRWPKPRLNRVEAGLLLGSLAAVVAALVLASATLPAKQALGFTQLWILPEAGSLGSEVQIGVTNDEQEAVDYDLRVRIGGRGTARPEPAVAGSEKIEARLLGLGQATALAAEIIRRSFHLEPGETRVVRVGPPAAPAGSAVPVVATLLRHNRPLSVYRRVKGWLVAPEGRR